MIDYTHMNTIEIGGSLYNLDQFVSLVERPKDPPPWRDDDESTETIITFVGGTTVKLSAEERDAVKRRIQS